MNQQTTSTSKSQSSESARLLLRLCQERFPELHEDFRAFHRMLENELATSSEASPDEPQSSSLLSPSQSQGQLKIVRAGHGG